MYDNLKKGYALENPIKRSLIKYNRIIFGEIVEVKRENEQCDLLLKIDCHISRRKIQHNNYEKLGCETIDPLFFPPRQHLVFIVNYKSIWYIFPSEELQETIFSKCDIESMYSAITSDYCKLLASMFLKNLKCWNELNMNNTCYNSHEKTKPDICAIFFFLLLLYGFVSMAVFKMHLSRGAKKYYI